MSNTIYWNCYGAKIPEKFNSAPDIVDIVDQDNPPYTISEIIREVYYVMTFRKIWRKMNSVKDYTEESYEHEELYEENLNCLSMLDLSMKNLMEAGKYIVSNLDKKYKCSKNLNPYIQSIVFDYAQWVFRILDRNDISREPEIKDRIDDFKRLLDNLEEPIHNLDNYFQNMEKELKTYLNSTNNQQSSGKTHNLRNKIEILVLDLLKYLGTPYSDRYDTFQAIEHLFKSLLIKNSNKNGLPIYQENHRQMVYTLIDMLPDNISDHKIISFNKYYDDSIYLLKSQFSLIQEQICNTYKSLPTKNPNSDVKEECMLIDKMILNAFNKGPDGMNGILDKIIPKYKKKTANSIKRRCFAIMDLHIPSSNNTEDQQFIAFSGEFDTTDTNLLNAFSTNKSSYKDLKNAIDHISDILKIKLVPINDDVPYMWYDKKYKFNHVTVENYCNAKKNMKKESDIELIKRMFSCCERKLLTKARQLTTSRVFPTCEIYVKYPPCEMCLNTKRFIDDKCRLDPYHIQIISPQFTIGHEIKTLKDFDKLAESFK